MNDTTPVRKNRNVSSSLQRAVQGLRASDSRTGRDATFRGHQGREKVMKAGTPGRPWNPTSFDTDQEMQLLTTPARIPRHPTSLFHAPRRPANQGWGALNMNVGFGPKSVNRFTSPYSSQMWDPHCLPHPPPSYPSPMRVSPPTILSIGPDPTSSFSLGMANARGKRQGKKTPAKRSAPPAKSAAKKKLAMAKKKMAVAGPAKGIKINDNITGYLNPFSTKQAVIPDGAVVASLPHTFKNTSYLDVSPGKVGHILMFPGIDAEMMMCISDPDRVPIGADVVTYTEYSGEESYVSNLDAGGQWSLRADKTDPRGFKEARFNYAGEVSKWRVVSQGVQCSLLNNPLNKYGFYESCCMQYKVECDDWQILSPKDNGLMLPGANDAE